MPSKQAHRPEAGDQVFQQYNWRAQRVGWVLLGILILAGLAGLLGPGPLSNVDARDGTSLQVSYERFVRHGARTEIRVKVTQPPSRNVRIAINQEYLDTLSLQQIIPAPTQAESSVDLVVYTFNRAGDGPMHVTFVMEPDKLGPHVARIGLADGSRITLEQFTFP